MPDTDGSCIEYCDINIQDEIWLGVDFELLEKCEEIAKATLSLFEGENKIIAILLCNDQTIQELNAKWRGFDKPTNVLSFEYKSNSPILGDIALSYNTCEKEASAQGKTFKNHFSHLLVHGILHLLGYDHIDDMEADEMENLEREILAKMGIDDPYFFNEALNGK